MIRLSTIAFIVLFTAACKNNDEAETSPAFKLAQYEQKQYMEIYPLIRRSPEEIKAILGKPNKVIKNPKDCALLNTCQLECHYRKDSITVLYRDNEALWFEFDGLQNHEFQQLPKILGLPTKKATSIGDGYVWYNDYKYIKKISFVASKENAFISVVDYIIVAVE